MGKTSVAGITLTLDVELHRGVGHPDHVLGDAAQLVVVVVSADVEESQVDGVGGGLDIRLQQEGERERQRTREYEQDLCPARGRGTL